MLNAIFIGIWAYLWVHHLTMPNEAFGWLRKAMTTTTLPMPLDKVLFSCAKCHAGQIALWTMVFEVSTKGATLEDAAKMVIVAIFVPVILEKWKG